MECTSQIHQKMTKRLRRCSPTAKELATGHLHRHERYRPLFRQLLDDTVRLATQRQRNLQRQPVRKPNSITTHHHIPPRQLSINKTGTLTRMHCFMPAAAGENVLETLEPDTCKLALTFGSCEAGTHTSQSFLPMVPSPTNRCCRFHTRCLLSP
jgi:hypothetical protein